MTLICTVLFPPCEILMLHSLNKSCRVQVIMMCFYMVMTVLSSLHTQLCKDILPLLYDWQFDICMLTYDCYNDTHAHKYAYNPHKHTHTNTHWIYSILALIVNAHMLPALLFISLFISELLFLWLWIYCQLSKLNCGIVCYVSSLAIDSDLAQAWVCVVFKLNLQITACPKSWLWKYICPILCSAAWSSEALLALPHSHINRALKTETQSWTQAC